MGGKGPIFWVGRTKMLRRLSFRFSVGGWRDHSCPLHLLPSVTLWYLPGLKKLDFPGSWCLELAWFRIELDVHLTDKK